MQLKNNFLIFSFLLFFSCAGIKVISKDSQFSDGFKEQIILVKKEMTIKNFTSARNILTSIKDENLKTIEKSEKYNVLGLIFFSEGNFSHARNLFIKALGYDFQEPQLVNQIVLNIASTEYKLGNFREAYNQLNSIDVKALSERDKKKTYILAYIMAKKLQRNDDEFFALVGLLSSIEAKRDLVGNRYYKILSHKFSKLEADKKLRLLSQSKDKTPSTVVAHLAYNQSMEFYKVGDEEKGKKLKEWIMDNFPNYQADFRDIKMAEIDVYEEIDIKKVGIILPLSGPKKPFGMRALDGITLALKQVGDPFKLIVRDSKNSVNAAATYARNLIVNDKVSLIIGGLFAETAQREYEAAQKLGGIYVSLSPVYMKAEKKGALLVELPGSIESQVNAALSGSVAANLGKRVAIFYPDNVIGNSYLDEFWKISDERQFEIITAGKFPENVTDYRDAISNMVGLKYEREREEEFQIWESIYKAKYKDIKRVQILKPVVEFDWVFVPSFPHQAVQIIPSFHYLGVKKIPFVGGPSWRSRTLISRQKMLGEIYYIGDLIEEKKESFRKLYFDEYKSEPKLLETLGYDSVHLAKEIIQTSDWQDRSSLNKNFTERKNVLSYLSEWKRIGQSWIKLMNVSKITSKGVQKI